MSLPNIAAEPDHPDRERLRQLGEKVRRRLGANKAAVPIVADGAELWGVGEFFSLEECARLIALTDAVAHQSTTYFMSRASGFRTSYSGIPDPRDPLVRRLQRRIDQLLGFDWTHAEPMEGQRYTPGQEFKPHTDWFQQASPGWAREKDNGGQRSFTAMVYLNAVAEGGETDFPRLDVAVAPRPGTLLVWNNADRDGIPNPLTIHAGNPVRRGTKHVVTRWYRCRPTRQLT